MAKNRKWYAYGLNLAIAGFGKRISFNIHPFIWRKFFFSESPFTLFKQAKNYHVYIGPFHIWTMDTEMFCIELELSYDFMHPEKPSKWWKKKEPHQ